MTQFYYFRNPGILPLIAITTLGVSDKDEGAIGRFGTGLKYTIAGALRLGQEISIESGGKTYYFKSKPEIARTKTFNIVWMEDVKAGTEERLGFTTELGKHWESWMYLRELYSNCVDEGGRHGWLDTAEQGNPVGPDETRIIVGGDQFSAAMRASDKWLLANRLIKAFPEKDLYLHERSDPFGNPKVFFKGILVGQLEQHFGFDVNMLGHFDDLTEDRTVKSYYHIHTRVLQGILGSSDEDLIEETFKAKPDSYLGMVGTQYGAELSPRAVEMLQNFWNTSPISLGRNWQARAARIFKVDDTQMTFELNPTEKTKFEKALSFMKKLGYTYDLEWNFVNPKDSEAYGFVRNNKVYICKMAFDNGTQFLTQVMLEEYLHAVKDLEDYSRAMQNDLFAKVISLGEELHGVL